MCENTIYTHIGDTSLPLLKTRCNKALYRHSRCLDHFYGCPKGCPEILHRAEPPGFISAKTLKLQNEFEEDAIWEDPDFLLALDSLPQTPEKKRKREQESGEQTIYSVSYRGTEISSKCDGLCSERNDYCAVHAFQLGLELAGVNLSDSESDSEECARELGHLSDLIN